MKPPSQPSADGPETAENVTYHRPSEAALVACPQCEPDNPAARYADTCAVHRGASGPAQPVSSQVTTAMVEAAIRAWNVAEPKQQVVGISYHRTFAEVITAALDAQAEAKASGPDA